MTDIYRLQLLASRAAAGADRDRGDAGLRGAPCVQGHEAGGRKSSRYFTVSVRGVGRDTANPLKQSANRLLARYLHEKLQCRRESNVGNTGPWPGVVFPSRYRRWPPAGRTWDYRPRRCSENIFRVASQPHETVLRRCGFIPRCKWRVVGCLPPTASHEGLSDAYPGQSRLRRRSSVSGSPPLVFARGAGGSGEPAVEISERSVAVELDEVSFEHDAREDKRRIVLTAPRRLRRAG